MKTAPPHPKKKHPQTKTVKCPSGYDAVDITGRIAKAQMLENMAWLHELTSRMQKSLEMGVEASAAHCQKMFIISLAQGNMLTDPECDEKDACLEHFEKKIDTTPLDGSKVLPLLRAVKRWQKNSDYVFNSLPFQGYISILAVCDLLLRRGVSFPQEALKFLTSYLGEALLAIPFEGWFEPQSRAVGLGAFAHRICAAEVNRLKPPSLSHILGTARRKRRKPGKSKAVKTITIKRRTK